MKYTAKIKTLALLLCALMVLPLFVSGCADNGSNNPDTTAPNETTAGAVDTTAAVAGLNLSEYVIIRPENEGTKYTELYSEFFKAFTETTGIKITLKDDFVREGTAFVEVEKEILIGKTNREESAKALEGKGTGDYVVTVIGSKIVINGTTFAALRGATEDFLTKVITVNSPIIAETFLYEGNIEYEQYFECLKGITFDCIGDSYLKGHTMDTSLTWPSLLGDKYEMKVYNYGENGSTVSDYVTTNKPMVVRYTVMKNDADIILVEGGRNDYNKATPIGDTDSTDTKTFAGAINTLITGLQKKFPNKLILFVTAWYVPTNTNGAGVIMQKYNETMLAVCEKRGIPCFNASDQKLTGVYMDDSSFRASYCLTANDISHLNPQGHENVMPAFEKFIGEEYQKFLAAKTNQ